MPNVPGQGIAAGVVELSGDKGSVIVHGVGQSSEPWDELVPADADHVGAARELIDRAAAHDDEPSTPCRPLCVELHQSVSDEALGSVGQMYGRHYDAVGQLQTADEN